MASYLRKINKNKWLKDSWVLDDNVPATALTDVGERNISVYEVPDNETARRTAIVIAAGGDHPDNVDYALFDADLESIKIDVREIVGTTLNQDINLLHRDLENMTVRTACDLAQIIGNNQITRVYRKEVISKIGEYCQTGILDRNKLKDSMRSSIPAGKG